MKRIRSIIRFRYIIPGATITLFIILLIIALWDSLYEAKQITEAMIVQDIDRLVQIFDHINRDCTITSFNYQKNPINFLNVGTFVGSELGPMLLAHPENWKGPYADHNPSIQGIEYQIVRTRSGHFITPGDRVKLPNGKTIGKDITLDEKADIDALMHDDKALRFKGKALAAPLSLGALNSGKLVGSLVMLDEEE